MNRIMAGSPADLGDVSAANNNRGQRTLSPKTVNTVPSQGNRQYVSTPTQKKEVDNQATSLPVVRKPYQRYSDNAPSNTAVRGQNKPTTNVEAYKTPNDGEDVSFFDNRNKSNKRTSESSLEISSITANSHGIDQYEHALLLYTFGEPEKTNTPLFVAVKYTIIVLILAALIWNPWTDSIIAKYLKNNILRFSIKLILFVLIFLILARIVS